MPNDSRSVGRPSNNPSRIEPRVVPVQHDKPRINDQRKVRPHTVGDPAMGGRPSGGTQKEPRKPSLGKERMQARDVPIKRMTEAELNEWNPFRRYSRTPLPISGDVLAWHHSKDGMHVLHIRDGHLVGKPNLVMSKDILARQMKDAMQQYWQAKNEKMDLNWHPKQAGLAAIKQYAKDSGITPVKVGEYGKDIPIAAGMGGGMGGPAASTGGAAPAAPSGPPGAGPGGTPLAASPAGPGGAGARPTRPAAGPGGTPLSSPGAGPGGAGPGGAGPAPKPASPVGGGSMNPGHSASWGSPHQGYQQNMTGRSHGLNGTATPAAPAGPRNVSGPMNDEEKGRFLQRIEPERYTDQVLQRMTPYQINQALNKMKIRGAAREGYPDTNFERDEPSHEARLGGLQLRGRMTAPKPPAPNKEFMQARELNVEKVHEMADQEMERFVRGAAARLGFKDIVFEDEVEGHPHFQHIKSGTRVTIRSPQGQDHSGRAVMRGPHGWVLNMGGRHGTPGIATPHNTVKVHGAHPAPAIEGALPRQRSRWVGEAGHLPEPSHPLPGNLPGTGKDFRPKPGHNKSKKQPGNLIGSNHVNKVKPGFVG